MTTMPESYRGAVKSAGVAKTIENCETGLAAGLLNRPCHEIIIFTMHVLSQNHWFHNGRNVIKSAFYLLSALSHLLPTVGLMPQAAPQCNMTSETLFDVGGFEGAG